MFLLIFITIAADHLAYLYFSSDKSSCTEPDRDSASCSQFTEAAFLGFHMKMKSIARFSDGRNEFRHRLEVEHCWSDDTSGIPNAQQNAERETQKKQQKQTYLNYSPRGLKTIYLQIKAQEQLMECPNATRNDFSTQIFQEDVLLQVCSDFLHDVGQIKIELATMRQDMKNFRTELQGHRVNCMEGNFRPWAPTQKGNQKTVRFCNYCHKNGHTPKWCCKKMRDEEIRKVRYEMSSTRKHVPTQDHGTNALNRSAQYDRNVDISVDLDDGNNPTNENQPTEGEDGQDEPNEFTPPEPGFFHRNNGMSFRMARFNSAEEFDN